MRKLLQLMIALVPLAVVSPALAVPTAFYDRPTGNIYVQTEFSLLITVLESPSGRLNGVPNDLPVFVEEFEQPHFLTYFGLLPTDVSDPLHLDQLYNLGPVVTDGGPVGDLSLRWLTSLELGFFPGRLVEIAEPSTVSLACLVLLALMPVRRRRRVE